MYIKELFIELCQTTVGIDVRFLETQTVNVARPCC